MTAVATGSGLGPIQIGQTITGSGVAQGTTITAFVSGTDGGVGTYTVSTLQTVTSETLNLTGSSALYGAAQAELNSSGQDPNAPANSDFIQFQAYSAVTINGSNGTSINAGAAFGPLFQITPNLSNYAPSATDQITEEAGSPNHTSAPLALEFVPNVGSGSGYSLAWNDVVTDSNGTHDQVEFAIYHPGATTPLVTQQTFQIPDNNPQSIRLLATTINGANVELLAYGDNTGTHVIEFDASGNELASIFDPMNQTFSQFVNFGDGRIALVYDNPVDALGTTQYVTHIYDLRTTGLNINDSALADGKDKYIAGTQFGDAFTGENNVNNTYYYVGQNTTATGPTDNFTGGGGTAWNVAILPDPATDYTITINGVGSATLVSNDLAHAGTLNVTNDQALAFNPAVDPSGNNGTLTATGGELYIIGSLPGNGEPITIDNGSALALGAGITDSGTITFAGTSGEAFLITPVDFTGVIAGISQGDSNQIIDLGRFSSQNTDTFTVTPTYNSGTNETTLLVTDTNNSKSESVLLAGNDTTGFTWTASPDGAGGAKVVDPPATLLSARAVGAASKPINLALANPPAANGGPVTVTVSGLPSDAQLNEGANLGNGSWSVQTTDLTSLTVLTAFVGAMLLNVTESWANADGTTGTATIADNVEAVTPGSPIFAPPNDDTLTGAGGNDLFVFAQPIGNDTIHNFNAASDQIDLMGVANVASFQDLQIAGDSNGDAVITVGSGETITLQGVNAASLTASDFVFDQTPTLNNSGTMLISDGAVLPLSGIIDNSGTIELNSTGDATELQIVGAGVTLEGGGQIVMSDSEMNFIVGTSSASVLTNVDNTISGAGEIGAGDGHLTLVNDSQGTIVANDTGGILTINTGNTVINDGALEATNGGTLQVDDPVTGSGSAVVAGGTLELAQQASINVVFDNGQTGTSYGELVLANPSSFSGQIIGFNGTAADAPHSDAIDLVGVNYGSSTFTEAHTASADVLTVSDGSTSASLTIDNLAGPLSFASDGHGGSLVTDPPADSSAVSAVVIATPEIAPGDSYSESMTPSGADYVGSVSVVQDSNGGSFDFGFALGKDQVDLAPGQTLSQSYDVSITDAQNPGADVSQNVSVLIGGPGSDNFIFTPGMGADSIVNFDPQQDTIELDHFASAQTVQQLQSLVTSDPHGDAVINLGHNDSITIAGETPTQLQQLIQAGHVLLH